MKKNLVKKKKKTIKVLDHIRVFFFMIRVFFSLKTLFFRKLGKFLTKKSFFYTFFFSFFFLQFFYHVASKLAKTTDFNIKNAKKFKFLQAQKWIKNRYKSSSGPKKCQKNYLKWFSDQFGSKLYFKEKSCQICPKIVKIPYFLNFTKS